ncbi:MAG: cysteine desulfurase family protein [Carboxydocellales bacterium]
MIYLDNSATTPVDREVLEAMLPYLKEEFGNPSSKYYTLAENAKKAVEDARQKVADLINCQPSEIVFTSGSSESNNFVIKGVADYYQNKGKHIITTSVEHKSVIETCKYLALKGYDVDFLKVNRYGQVEPDTLEKAIRQDTILVSIMWGNNEIGSLNGVAKLAQICKENEIFLHCDATQVIGKVEVDMQEIPMDFLSLSAHKFYGPKGIGACFIRKNKLGLKTKITPLIHGGGQENGYRAGTLAVHNIVGLGKAAEIAKRSFGNYVENLRNLESSLTESLVAQIKEIRINTPLSAKIPGVLSLTIPGVNNELLVRDLANSGFAVSTGSACSANEPSYVLSAIGMPLDEIRSTIRLTLNKYQDKVALDFVSTIKSILTEYT